ncbi:hypothetical protein Bca101_097139 [Brassica carinata]
MVQINIFVFLPPSSFFSISFSLTRFSLLLLSSMSSLSSTSLDLSSCRTPSELLGVVIEEAEEIDGGGVSRGGGGS